MTDPNSPAFPIPDVLPSGQGGIIDLRGTANSPSKGLTKRELFAGLAMQGILANPSGDTREERSVVELSVCAADALIAALKVDK